MARSRRFCCGGSRGACGLASEEGSRGGLWGWDRAAPGQEREHAATGRGSRSGHRPAHDLVHDSTAAHEIEMGGMQR